jgi:hypothetical protein
MLINLTLKLCFPSTMALGDNSYSIGDPSAAYHFYNDIESQLCVPQDRLEDIEMFPSFNDDPILASDLGDFPASLEKVAGETKRLPLQDSDRCVANINRGITELTSLFPRKKPRTKRSWSDVHIKPSFFKKENRKQCWAENIKRRCTHCQAEKTPQWREGPSGPKTLCNACGVRYKSGRLVPEYRPFGSPTFDNRMHSNFHKQILKRTQAFKFSQADFEKKGSQVS